MIITDFNEMSIGDLEKVSQGLPISFVIEDGKITMSAASFKNLCRPETVIARTKRKKK